MYLYNTESMQDVSSSFMHRLGGIESPIAKRFLETGTSSTREGTRSVPDVFIVWCRIAKTDSPANIIA